MKRLLAICPNLDDATSFWRGVGPLTQLGGWHTTFATEHRFTWSTLIQYDAIFVQRPTSSQHVALMLMAKELNIPTWIDYDDDVTDVPYSNPAFHTYMRSDTQAAIKACLQAATAVTVSTKPLKKLRADAVVVPNAWNDFRWPLKERTPPEHKTIVWRGSPTHDEDLLVWADDLVKMHDGFPEYQWLFLGGCPWQLMDRFKSDRVAVYSGTDLPKYISLLEEIRPTWMIVPLKDSPFNHAKSNIAWQEATYAGAAALTPWWEEWRGNGACTYTTGSMYTKFAAFHEDAAEFVDQSRWVLSEHYLLSDVNKQREALLERLVCKKGK